MIEPTPLIRDLLDTLREAGYPTQYPVTYEQHEAVETWLQANIDERRARWRAAGSPDEWPEDLGPMFCGPHFGVMLKNVELVAGWIHIPHPRRIGVMTNIYDTE